MIGANPVVPGSIGVMGGAFDPIHVGHLAVAEEAREALGLERVLFVPTGSPAHRGAPIAAPEDRLAMVDAAIAGNPAFEASRIELDRVGPSYTLDTLEALAAAQLAAGQEPNLVLILSAETFHDLPAWHEPRRILGLARLAVAPRVGHATPDLDWFETRFPGLGGRVTYLDGPRLGVSSSALRARLAAGRSIRYLAPAAVAAYIGEHMLYNTTSRAATAPAATTPGG